MNGFMQSEATVALSIVGGVAALAALAGLAELLCWIKSRR